MRIILLCIVLLLFVKVHSQPNPPAGVWNSWHYTMGDSIEHSIFTNAAITANGRLYLDSYSDDNRVLVVGNNYIHRLRLPEENMRSNVTGLYALGDTLWVRQSNYLTIYVNEQLLTTYPLPAGLLPFYESETLNPRYITDKNNTGEDVLLYCGNDSATIVPISLAPNEHLENTFFHNGRHYLSTFTPHAVLVYELLPGHRLLRIAMAPLPLGKEGDFRRVLFDGEYIAIFDPKSTYIFKSGRLVQKTIPPPFTAFTQVATNAIMAKSGEYKTLYVFKNGRLEVAGNVFFNGAATMAVRDDVSGNGSYYTGASNKPFRVFPYIKKYPAIYNHTNSAETYALVQDINGRIWAGSYNGYLSIIDGNKLMPVNCNNTRFIDGPFAYKDKVYLFAETPLSLLAFDRLGKMKAVTQKVSGFFSYRSKYSPYVYFAMTTPNGVWRTHIDSLYQNKPNWHIIDTKKGFTLKNAITITEDTTGRVWMGQGGLSIYNPKTDRAVTWLYPAKEIPFGLFSSCTDHKGTVWLGTSNDGLRYYNNYNSQPSPEAIEKLDHPLISGLKIWSLAQWGKWLVIAAHNKIALLDLDAWHGQKKVILRYLNPQELALDGFTGQNNFLIDKRDSSLWFASSNMVYQWQIKQWLSLPTYPVNPQLAIHTNDRDTTLAVGEKMFFSPRQNALSIRLWFQSKDNMPRYMRVALVKDKDSIIWSDPTPQTEYAYNNLASGHYRLMVQVFQSDGTTSEHIYFLIIKSFIWQRWWFWLAIGLMITGILFYYYNLRRQRQLALQKARTTAAELEAYQQEQERKLADLRLAALSSQFRPHFILNALNTIGAKMNQLPNEESVISSLGESVNLIFNHTRSQGFAHDFATEWKLVTNVIRMHRLMYLKELQVTLPKEDILLRIKKTEVPLGLLQIPVENALLHGLNNRKEGPWTLDIAIEEERTGFVISITDNGVGRNKALRLSNATRHGTGLKNLMEMIAIINTQRTAEIAIRFEDDIFKDVGTYYGTKTIIYLPK